MDAISIALSGLNAQQTKLAATAQDIANVSTTGRVPTPQNPSSTVYRPLDVSFTALTVGQGEGAGVAATVRERQDVYTLVYDPDSLDANANGFIAAPNVDLTASVVDAITAKLAFKANLSVIKVEQEIQRELLDTIA